MDIRELPNFPRWNSYFWRNSSMFFLEIFRYFRLNREQNRLHILENNIHKFPRKFGFYRRKLGNVWRLIRRFPSARQTCAAVLRKNAVWAIRRCQVSFDKNRLYLENFEHFPPKLFRQLCAQFNLKYLKMSRKTCMSVVKNTCFITGILVTLECSYGVFP